ncbi:TPA: hypothetical protein ACGUVT_004930 [Vibrio vulnificus]
MVKAASNQRKLRSGRSLELSLAEFLQTKD